MRVQDAPSADPSGMLGFAALALIYLASQFLGGWAARSLESLGSEAWIARDLGLHLGALLIVIAAGVMVRGRAPEPFGLVAPVGRWLGPSLVAVLPFTGLVIGLMSVEYYLRDPDAYLLPARQPWWGALWIELSAAVIAVPIAEEVLFRGLLLAVLARRIGTAAAVVVSAGLFTLAHDTYVVGIFASGLLYGLLRVYTGSLLPGLVVHAGYNLVVTLEPILLRRWPGAYLEGRDLDWWAQAETLGLLIGVGWALHLLWRTVCRRRGMLASRHGEDIDGGVQPRQGERSLGSEDQPSG